MMEKQTIGLDTNNDEPKQPGREEEAQASASSRAEACEGLVFGQLEDEEEFATPLTGSRASSGQLDLPTAELDAMALGHATAAAAVAAVAAAGLIDSAGSSESSSQPAAAEQEAAVDEHADATAQGQPSHGSGKASSALAAGTSEAAAFAATDMQPPQLLAAARDEASGPTDQQQQQQQQPVLSYGSGLVTLSRLTQQPCFGDSSGVNSSSETESDSEADWKDCQRTSSPPPPAAAGQAAAAFSTLQPATNIGGSSSSNGLLPKPDDHHHQQQQQQEQQQDMLRPHSGSSGGSTQAAAGAAAGRSRSPIRQVQEQQQQHQSRHRSFSPARSPLCPSSPVSGLERTASWQLQHAAAAAAGTAAHSAPPRSDLHLTRLGSGAVSPAPPSPAAAAAAAAATSSSSAAASFDDGWSAWQRKRRHFFVLTAAGKPVFSRHGDEQALAGFMAVIQALVSVVADQGDTVQSFTVGSCQLVFLLAGQLYLVAVSSRGEAPAALRRQLELLYQSILMVVTGGIEKMLQRNPGYDVQQLLAGSKASMAALTSSFSDCPGWMFGTVEPAAAAPADRQAAAAALAGAVKASEALYGVVLVGRRLLAAETGKGPPPLNVYDLLLLINFTNSNESLRHSETFVPVCLPNFQPKAFLHAYIANIEPAEQQQQEGHQQQQQQEHAKKALQHPHDCCPSSVFLLLLSGSADSFHKLSAAKQAFVAALATVPTPNGAAAAAAASSGAAAAGSGGAPGVLCRVIAAAAALPGAGRLRVESLPAPVGGPVGSTPLWHAVIRYPQRRQHITLNFPPELFPLRPQRKQLVRSYCRLFCAAHSQVLEAAAAAGSTGGGSGSSSMGGHHGSVLGPLVPNTPGGAIPAGAVGVSSSSIANIVGAASAATGAVGSGAAAAAAAAAAYMLPYAGGQPRLHKVVWVTGQRWVTGVLVDREVELYVTFDPLTEKDVGLKLAETLRRAFADRVKQHELLVPGL